VAELRSPQYARSIPVQDRDVIEQRRAINGNGSQADRGSDALIVKFPIYDLEGMVVSSDDPRRRHRTETRRSAVCHRSTIASTRREQIEVTGVEVMAMPAVTARVLRALRRTDCASARFCSVTSARIDPTDTTFPSRS